MRRTQSVDAGPLWGIRSAQLRPHSPDHYRSTLNLANDSTRLRRIVPRRFGFRGLSGRQSAGKCGRQEPC